jgi:hypothetical protein
MKRRLLSYLLLISLLSAASAKEFQVNTRPACDQTYADIAMDANGNFVVVWTSYFENDNSNDIFGRLFDSDANPLGGEFLINTTRLGNQKEPSVAADAVGNFVVAWQGPGPNEEDIFAQRFEPNGQPIGSEFRVNTNTDSRQLSPSVAMDNGGKFIVVWECLDMPQPGNSAIHGQLYDRFGSKIKNELTISDKPSTCCYPAVAMDNSGEVIVVWTGVSPSNYYVYVRHFEADGNEPFLYSKKVDDEDFTNLTKPSLAVDGADNYVIAWDGRCTGSDSQNIYIKRFQWTHVHLHENQFIVNTQQAGDQTNPVVAMNDDSFVVVWESDAESESNQRNIFGQRDDGEFVAAWQSRGQDGSGYGIFADSGPAVPCADFTGDWFVNFRDYCILAEEWLKDQNPLKTDLVDDNKIDHLDLNAFCGRWLMPCYDCNDVDIYTDGKIDFKDYCLWAQGYLQQGPLKGDVTGNGTVDLTDLKALIFHWAKSCE